MLRTFSAIGRTAFATRKQILLLACAGFLIITLFAHPWTLLADQRAGSEPARRAVEPGVRSAALTPPASAPDRASMVGGGGSIGGGLAENAWDFTAPNGVPGFGPLDPADARQLLERVGQTSAH